MHDQPSFEGFVGGCLPSLGRYAYALTGDRYAGEDLVQDTLVKLLGAWRRVRADGNPAAYARTVMFRTYISRWRLLRRQPPQQLDHSHAAPRDEFELADMRDSLRRALQGISRLQRAVLVLSYLDDMSDDDIAELLNRKPATIRSLRARGLASLRTRMQEISPMESIDA